MSAKPKAEYEKEFVQHLLEVGIKGYSEMYAHGRLHYMFNLENGETRYWTNLSEDSLKKLGLREEDK